MDDVFDQLVSFDDRMLSSLAAAVAEEQRRRAVELADVDALVDLGFERGFAGNGMPVDPWIQSGMLICPGAKVDRTKLNHDCAFVNLSGTWSWEHDEREAHVIRHVPGVRPAMRSVTLFAAVDGLELDLVASRTKMAVHEMRSVRSFVVRGGELVLVQARAREAAPHR